MTGGDRSSVSLDSTTQELKSRSFLRSDAVNTVFVLGKHFSSATTLLLEIVFPISFVFTLWSLALDQTLWEGPVSGARNIDDYTWRVWWTLRFPNSESLYMLLVSSVLLALVGGLAYNFVQLWKGKLKSMRWLTVLCGGASFFRYVIYVPFASMLWLVMTCKFSETFCYRSFSTFLVLIAGALFGLSFLFVSIISSIMFSVSPVDSVWAQTTIRFIAILVLTVTLNVVLDGLTFEEHALWTMVLGCISYSLSLLVFFKYLPFYSMMMNYIIAYFLSMIVGTYFFQIIADLWLDRALLGLLVVLIGSVGAGFLGIGFVFLRVLLLKRSSPVSSWELELKLRTRYIVSGKKGNHVTPYDTLDEQPGETPTDPGFRDFEEALQEYPSAQVCMTFALYAFQRTQNRELCMHYLSSAKSNRHPFDVAILLKARIQQFCPPEHAETLERDSMMRQAEMYCHQVNNLKYVFWSSIMRSKLNFARFSKALNAMNKAEGHAERLYTRLVNRFPTNSTVLRTAAKFYEDQKKDSFMAESLYNKADEYDDTQFKVNLHNSRSALGDEPASHNDMYATSEASRQLMSEAESKVSIYSRKAKEKSPLATMTLVFIGIIFFSLVFSVLALFFSMERVWHTFQELNELLPSISNIQCVLQQIPPLFLLYAKGIDKDWTDTFFTKMMKQRTKTLMENQRVLTTQLEKFSEVYTFWSQDADLSMYHWKQQQQQFQEEKSSLLEGLSIFSQHSNRLVEYFTSGSYTSLNVTVSMPEWRFINDNSMESFLEAAEVVRQRTLDTFNKSLYNGIILESFTTTAICLALAFISSILIVISMAYFTYIDFRIIDLFKTIPKSTISRYLHRIESEMNFKSVEYYETSLRRKWAVKSKLVIANICFVLVMALFYGVNFIMQYSVYEALVPHGESLVFLDKTEYNYDLALSSGIKVLFPEDMKFFDSNRIQPIGNTSHTSLFTVFKDRSRVAYRKLKYGHQLWEGAQRWLPESKEIFEGQEWYCESLENCSGMNAFYQSSLLNLDEKIDGAQRNNQENRYILQGVDLTYQEWQSLWDSFELMKKYSETISSLLIPARNEELSQVWAMGGLLTLVVLNSLVTASCSYMMFLAWKNLGERKRIFKVLLALPFEELESIPEIKTFLLTGNIGSNMSEQKEMLKQSTQSLLQASADAVIVCEDSGLIVEMNRKAHQLFKVKAEHTIGLHISQVVRQADSSKRCITEILNMNKGTSQTFEGEFLRKDDTSFPASLSASCGSLGNKRHLAIFIRDLTQETLRNNLLVEEKEKSENLLLSILPRRIARRLQAGEKDISDAYNNCTVLFLDMVSFTAFSSTVSPSEIVMILNSVFSRFDAICKKYGVEKIKTIGDAYMAVCGLENEADHALKTVEAAWEMLETLETMNKESENRTIQFRCGVNSGQVVGGVIGSEKFQFDIWGDCVNVASRLESTGLPGRVQVSRSTYELCHQQYHFEERVIDVKGKGKLIAYMCKGRKISSKLSNFDLEDQNEENHET